MPRTHTYELTVTWTGNLGTGTSGYRSYERDHEVTAHRLPVLLGSSDPSFRGDATRWSPEQLLVAALSQCHMLWYLHLAADRGIVVTEYIDHPVGVMTEDAVGLGRFTVVTLRPMVGVTHASMVVPAGGIHAEANASCFIARSVNFPVAHEPRVSISRLERPGSDGWK
jgi:organic hydroperoxide reductase OsmC/OhrA